MDYAARAMVRRMSDARTTLSEIAHNLANSDTPGFKRYISASFTEKSEGASSRQPATGNGGGQVWRRASRIDMTVGDLRHTGRPLDLAIEDPTCFFAVDTEEGIRFTRHGRFRINRDGVVVNPEGHPLVSEEGGLQLPPKTNEITVRASGEFLVNGQRVGKINVYRLENIEKLRGAGKNLFRYADPVPRPVPSGSVVQGTFEESNVQPVHELVRLITASRSYENSTRMIQRMGRVKRNLVDQLT
jgi:flagellar basal body rod protein FlgG